MFAAHPSDFDSVTVARENPFLHLQGVRIGDTYPIRRGSSGLRLLGKKIFTTVWILFFLQPKGLE